MPGWRRPCDVPMCLTFKLWLARYTVHKCNNLCYGSRTLALIIMPCGRYGQLCEEAAFYVMNVCGPAAFQRETCTEH
jgi:hypothetical protein